MSAAASHPPVAVGRYLMYGCIGTGGMAAVHLGRSAGEAGSGVARTVAIKRLLPHLVGDPQIVAAFTDEAKLAARIHHPNVVAMLDVVSQGGELFLVMEYVDGVPLSSLVRSDARGPGLAPPMAAAIMAQALRGLHAAHEVQSESHEALNLVHRDVSPHNLLVGTDGIVRVADFGVAKALGRQHTTRDGRIKGKLGYMPPEQLKGEAVTRKADIFAAGVVLWELLTGQPLFRGLEEAETLARTLFSPIPLPSEVWSEAPRALDPVVARALERDPLQRYATASEMALAIESAVPPATRQSVGEWVRGVGAAELTKRARELETLKGSWRGSGFSYRAASPLQDQSPAELPRQGASANSVRDFGGLRVDVSDWPILLMEFPEARVADSDLQAALDHIEQLLLECQRKGEKCAQITDLTRMRSATATQRKIAGEWVKRNSALFAVTSVGNAAVTPSMIVRGLVTAVFWIQKPPTPTTFVATRSEGLRFLFKLLREAQVLLPPRLCELRDRLAVEGKSRAKA